MTLTNLARTAEKIIADNSPTILTGVAVAGTITTAILTGQAAVKATELISGLEINRIADLENDLNRPITDQEWPHMSRKEKLKASWKVYIPAAGSGLVTITCIVAANRIGTRRAAAMAAAYTVSEKAFAEYKDKIVDRIGEKQERSARDELAQDRVNKNPASKTEVIITGSGDVLCYDTLTGRYFKSNMESLRKAQNDLNAILLNQTFASLSEFYRLLDLPATELSEELGWNVDRLLEIEFSTVLSEDNRPCISIIFDTVPIRGYHRLQ